MDDSYKQEYRQKIIRIISQPSLIIITTALIFTLYKLSFIWLYSKSSSMIRYLESYRVVVNEYSGSLNVVTESEVSALNGNKIILDEKSPAYDLLADMRSSFAKYFSTGNVDGIVSLFIENGRENNIVSQAAIRQFYNNFFKSNQNRNIEFIVGDITKKKNEYIERGNYTVTLNDAKYNGNYVMTAVQQNNDLKIKSLFR